MKTAATDMSPDWPFTTSEAVATPALPVVKHCDSPLCPRAQCPRRRATRALLTLPGETRAPLLACHVPGVIFNPAVTTTAKGHTTGLPGSRRGRRCVRGRAWTSERWNGFTKRWEEERVDNVVDDKRKKMIRVTRDYVPLNVSLWLWDRTSCSFLLPHFLQTSATPTSITSGFYMVEVFLARGNRREAVFGRDRLCKVLLSRSKFLQQDCSLLFH